MQERWQKLLRCLEVRRYRAVLVEMHSSYSAITLDQLEISFQGDQKDPYGVFVSWNGVEVFASRANMDNDFAEIRDAFFVFRKSLETTALKNYEDYVEMICVAADDRDRKYERQVALLQKKTAEFAEAEPPSSIGHIWVRTFDDTGNVTEYAVPSWAAAAAEGIKFIQTYSHHLVIGDKQQINILIAEESRWRDAVKVFNSQNLAKLHIMFKAGSPPKEEDLVEWTVTKNPWG